MSELKPCPFCGNKDNKVTDVVGFYYVKCKNCFAGTRPFLTSEGAVDAWNTRVKEVESDE